MSNIPAGASRRRVRPLAVCSLMTAVLLLAACGGAQQSDDSTPSPAPEPASEAVASTPAEAASASAAPAQADATITGVDYAFEAGDVSAGDAVEFVNGSDKEAHEMVVMRVTDDNVTLEDIQQLLAQGSEAPPPEYLEEAGFAFAMPGDTAEQTVTFEQGRYLLLCFIPQNAPPDVVAQMMQSAGSEEPEIPSEVQSELGPPHAVAGMIDLIEVE
jgi:plastocyanin